jgi:hypothetical protein
VQELRGAWNISTRIVEFSTKNRNLDLKEIEKSATTQTKYLFEMRWSILNADR